MRKFKAVRVSRKQHSLQRSETVSSGELHLHFGAEKCSTSMFQCFNVQIVS